MAKIAIFIFLQLFGLFLPFDFLVCLFWSDFFGLTFFGLTFFGRTFFGLTFFGLDFLTVFFLLDNKVECFLFLMNLMILNATFFLKFKIQKLSPPRQKSNLEERKIGALESELIQKKRFYVREMTRLNKYGAAVQPKPNPYFPIFRLNSGILTIFDLS